MEISPGYERVGDWYRMVNQAPAPKFHPYISKEEVPRSLISAWISGLRSRPPGGSVLGRVVCPPHSTYISLIKVSYDHSHRSDQAFDQSDNLDSISGGAALVGAARVCSPAPILYITVRCLAAQPGGDTVLSRFCLLLGAVKVHLGFGAGHPVSSSFHRPSFSSCPLLYVVPQILRHIRPRSPRHP